LKQDVGLEKLSMVCELSEKPVKKGSGWMVGKGIHQLGILGGSVKGRVISTSLIENSGQKGILEAHLAFFPAASEADLAARLEQEAHPLPPEAFRVTNGIVEGYDAAKGFYKVKNITGLGASGFTSFYLNPNMYLSTGIRISNDELNRKVYFKHYSQAGAIETAILTDTTGFPLPVAVECAKNFGGEKEEPDDSPFSESYFALQLEPGERMAFNVLHLHMHWGNHAIRQVSSIRFFQIYYHLSQGVTETTCFSLPTKFGSLPSGEARAYTLADYRPLSGQTWHTSPQHHHVSLQGWLQYLDAGGNWRYPVYRNSRIFSAGPNLAWFTMDFVSSDGHVDQHLEIIEMPQDDESRTHIRLRYTFNEDVVVKGDMTRNMRLINKGSYIRRVHWKELAWTDPSGEIKTHPMDNSGQWSVTGKEIRPYNSFFCAYPHADGNDAIVIRKVSGNVNGESFNKIGASAIGHEDGKTELMIVPLLEGNTIRKGSVIELDCILIPYGNESSNWGVPFEESIRFGLNDSAYREYLDMSGAQEQEEPRFGPSLEASIGTKILDLPPFIRAENNMASLEFNGAHDRIALVASGFSHEKYPLLWEEKAFLDAQVRGHDGLQSFQNRDGTYGFVFTPRARTTRVSGEWGSKVHTYHITQAVSSTDIKSISNHNGRVRIEQYKAGAIELGSPRIWSPASNDYIQGTLFSSRSQARTIETVPITFPDIEYPETIEMLSYSPEGSGMVVTWPAGGVIHMDGLLPMGKYNVEIGGDISTESTDKYGKLVIHIPGTEEPEWINIRLKK